jgi:hypothetical protein
MLFFLLLLAIALFGLQKKAGNFLKLDSYNHIIGGNSWQIAVQA